MAPCPAATRRPFACRRQRPVPRTRATIAPGSILPCTHPFPSSLSHQRDGASCSPCEACVPAPFPAPRSRVSTRHDMIGRRSPCPSAARRLPAIVEAVPEHPVVNRWSPRARTVSHPVTWSTPEPRARGLPGFIPCLCGFTGRTDRSHRPSGHTRGKQPECGSAAGRHDARRLNRYEHRVLSPVTLRARPTPTRLGAFDLPRVPPLWRPEAVTARL